MKLKRQKFKDNYDLRFYGNKKLKNVHQNCAVAFGLQLKDVFVGQISGKLALLKKIIYIFINVINVINAVQIHKLRSNDSV